MCWFHIKRNLNLYESPAITLAYRQRIIAFIFLLLYRYCEGLKIAVSKKSRPLRSELQSKPRSICFIFEKNTFGYLAKISIY